MSSDSPRVLVVDDDPQILQLICIVLNRAELQCVAAGGGGTAIEKLAGGAYDAIILDLTMPNVSGFEVIRHLEENNPALLNRLIVLTAMSDTASTRLDRTKFFSVLAKPFDVEALADTVTRCVDSARAAQPPGR
jgi:CheY-like chemotaxis protein